MNYNLVHHAFTYHIKVGRNVILVVENHRQGREHLRIAADHYRYLQVSMRKEIVIFESKLWLKTVAVNRDPDHGLRGHKNTVILTDPGAFRFTPLHQRNETVALINYLNERTMSHGTDNQQPQNRSSACGVAPSGWI